MPQNRHYKQRGILLGIAVAVITVGVWARVAGSQPVGTIGTCAHLPGHLYEACSAYLVNDTGVRYDYYVKANEADRSEAGDALDDFKYRWRGQARSYILAQVAKWPREREVVDIPIIHIVSATSNGDVAYLTTRERWVVQTSDGRQVWSEGNKLHHITLQHVPGKHLHIWVVTNMS